MLEIPLLRGRLFGDLDNEKAPQVAVINQAMARTYWPNGDPLGKRLKVRPSSESWITVIGVIANARTESLADAGVPQIYLSVYQTKAKELAIFLRGQLDPGAIPAEVREQVQSVNPELPVYGAQTLADALSASLAGGDSSMEMVASFAATALLLAGLGIYGVISYIVSERTHDIGIRLALGAQRAEYPGDGSASGTGARDFRRRGGAGWCADRVAPNGRAALRREADRSSYVRGGHPCAYGCGARGLLYPRASGHAHQPSDRAPLRITLSSPTEIRDLT